MLKSLVAIEETGSFACAAEKVFITQAAISQQMRKLEEDLGIHLFERSGRTPVFTQEAHDLLPLARDAIRAYDHFVATARNDHPISGLLSIGAVPSELTSLVPKALSILRADFPGLRIRIVPALSAELSDAVAKGTIDAAVLSKPVQIQSNLTWSTIGYEALALATSREERRTDAREILKSAQYLKMPHGAWINDPIEKVFQALNVKPRTSMDLDNLASVASMVVHGLGVAILPVPLVPSDVSAKLKFISLGHGTPKREIGVLYKTYNDHQELINAFLGAVNTMTGTLAMVSDL